MLMALVALVFVAVTYREMDRTGEPQRSMKKTFSDMFKLFGDVKFVTFILIFTGFDLMFWQLYISIPKYIVTHLSETAPMELIVAINPLMIILLQLPVARIVMKMKSTRTMALGMGISALAMVMMGLIPTLWGACLSIVLFALGEMTFAPRFLDYVSSLAPKGKVGLYLGFAYVRSFLANLIGGPLGGYLLAKYVPEEGTREPWKMFFVFAAVGMGALIALFFYNRHYGEQSEDGVAAGEWHRRSDVTAGVAQHGGILRLGPLTAVVDRRHVHGGDDLRRRYPARSVRAGGPGRDLQQLDVVELGVRRRADRLPLRTAVEQGEDHDGCRADRAAL
jgi:MFS family permease